MGRTPGYEELFYDRMGDTFATALSDYDTRRRVDVLVDDFLSVENLKGKRIIDVGCGLGFFSERLARLGADVVAVDIAPTLVEKVRRRVGCEAVVADALELSGRFGAESFDGVVSSECIEHTPDPARAILEMCRILKPAGFLSISTPNILWWPVVQASVVMRLRKFAGLENFSSWATIRRALSDGGARVEREYGLHLVPFQLPMHRLSTHLDRRLQSMRGLMINLCVLARKGESADVSRPGSSSERRPSGLEEG